MLNKSIKFLIENKLVEVFLLAIFIEGGKSTSPFDRKTESIPRNLFDADTVGNIKMLPT